MYVTSFHQHHHLSFFIFFFLSFSLSLAHAHRVVGVCVGVNQTPFCFFFLPLSGSYTTEMEFAKISIKLACTYVSRCYVLLPMYACTHYGYY
jgi:hypothetical protein